MFNLLIIKWIKECVVSSTKKIYSKNEDEGTPQSIILGLLIFLIFINDIPDFVVQSQILMYADDESNGKYFNWILGLVLYEQANYKS